MVLYLLTVDQKQQRINNSECCLQLFQKGIFVRICNNRWDIDPPLHPGVKSAVSWVDSSKWKLYKVTKDANISTQGFGLCILGCASYFVHWLPWERKNHKQRILFSIIGAFEGRNHQKMATKLTHAAVWCALLSRQCALLSRQCTMSQVDRSNGKTTWIVLWIAPAPTLFSRSGP